MADIKVSQFAEAVLAQLETAYDEKQKQAIKETAALIKETDNVVRQHITFKTREGGYADNTAEKKVTGEFRQWSYVWYVKKPDYRLTHLLEHGHDMPKDILKEIAKKNNVKIYNLQKKMCSYASENDSECIAEAICDFMTNGYKAVELSQLVVRFFREQEG